MTSYSSKSLIFCLNAKTIRSKQAKVHFTYFVERDQPTLNLAQSPILINVRFRCSSRRSFLNSPLSKFGIKVK